MLLGGTGFFIDTFTARAEGIVWLQLAAGEQIDIEPGGWVYEDRTVRMETEFQRFSTGLLASAGQLVCRRAVDVHAVRCHRVMPAPISTGPL